MNLSSPMLRTAVASSIGSRPKNISSRKCRNALPAFASRITLINFASRFDRLFRRALIFWAWWAKNGVVQCNFQFHFKHSRSRLEVNWSEFRAKWVMRQWLRALAAASRVNVLIYNLSRFLAPRVPCLYPNIYRILENGRQSRFCSTLKSNGRELRRDVRARVTANRGHYSL